MENIGTPRAGEIQDAGLLRVGVALFDNPDLKTSVGWCCYAGGEVRRIEAIDELDSDIYWLSNIRMFKDGGLNSKAADEYLRYSNLLKTQTLDTPLGFLIKDLGYLSDTCHPKEMAHSLSTVVSNYALQVQRYYGISGFSSYPCVSDQIKELIFDEPSATKHVVSLALNAAYQRRSFCPSVRPDGGKITVPVRRNRLHHAYDVMQGTYPYGGWHFCEAEKLGATNDQRIATLLKIDSHVLINVSVRSRKDPGSRLFAFGCDALNFMKSRIRNFVTGTELAYLVGFCDVEIKFAFIAADSKKVHDSQFLPEILYKDPLNSLSLSCQLVAESHLIGAIKQHRNQNRKPSLDPEHFTSEMTTFLSARDRMITFSLALKLHQAGFTVTSYSNGCVWLQIASVDAGKLANFVIFNGLASPIASGLQEFEGIHSSLNRSAKETERS